MKQLAWIFLSLLAVSLNSLHAEDLPGLHEPLKTVTKSYLVIQQKLAGDSFDGITAAATQMKATMAADASKSFAPDFVRAVDALAAATDLHTARLAFQQVSSGLIAALAESHAQTGAIHSAYCPMIKAYWVQADGRTVHNPYYGAAMPDCGEIQRQF